MSYRRSAATAASSAARGIVALVIALTGCTGDEGAEAERQASMEGPGCDGGVPDVMDASLGADAATTIDAGLEPPDGGGEAEAPDPKQPYFASVSANGTGCPEGSWTANISPDGQRFHVTFRSFEAEVDPSMTVSVKDCTLSVNVHSAEGMSFAFDGLELRGYSYLEEDVRGRLQANYYFQGAPDQGVESLTELRGPMDDELLVPFRHDTPALLWSRCGVDRTLQVRLTMRVLNSEGPRRSGYMTIPSVSQPLSSLRWRKCEL